MNIDCTESEKFYELNRILGLKEETTTDEVTSNELTPIDNNKSGDRLNTYQNKENNQRYKPLINNPNRNNAQTVIRNQISRRTTVIPYINTANTERIAQTTNFRDFNNIDRSESTTVNEFIPSTTFPPINRPVNIAQFFDLTTRKLYNLPTTTTTATFNDNSEYTTDYASTGSVNEYDSNTRIIPDLIEDGNKNTDQARADEVVESIKQLQKLFPSTVDDSREKRLLVKADSVKNRKQLFEMLNQH